MLSFMEVMGPEKRLNCIVILRVKNCTNEWVEAAAQCHLTNLEIKVGR